MRIWQKLVKAVTESPRGYIADGRTLGLGLATAMAKQDHTADVEEYLRHRAVAQRQSVSS